MRLPVAVSAILALLLVVSSPATPATPQEQLNSAVDAYGRGGLAEAAGLLEPLRADPGPTGGRAAYLLGVVELLQKQFPEAASAFDQAERALPVLAEYARYYQAVAAFDAGRFDLAAQGFQSVLTRFPASTLRGLALFWRAESLWGARSPEAPAVFHRYLEEFGQGRHAAQAWFEMGEALEQQGQWADAAQAYRRVQWGFEASPYFASARARLAALASTQRLPSDTTPPEVFYRRGLAEVDAGRAADAAGDLQRALAMPDGWRVADGALYTLGILAFQARRWEDAAGNFRRDANLKQTHGDDALFWLERIALIRGSEADAFALAHRLIKEYPHSSLAPRSLYAIAEARQDRGAIGPAVTAYRETAEQFPRTRWGDQALWMVGWLQNETRQWTAARTTWLRLAERSPDADATPAALYWAARTAAAQGHPDLADSDDRRLAAQYAYTYYGQRAAAHLGIPLRIPIAPALPEIPSGEVPALDRYRELDALAQTDDATRELEAAAAAAPVADRDTVLLLLVHRRAQQDKVRQSIAEAEEISAAAGGPRGRGLTLSLWQALYPQAHWQAVTQAASRTGVDPYLLAGVIREESRFDPEAVSSAGAYGLMQLMPGTARSTARSLGLPSPDLRALSDPATNIALGASVLAGELARFGRVDLALAAYNAGPGVVARWQGQHPGVDPETFVEAIPYNETRDYVKTVLQSAAMYRWLYHDGHPSPPP